MKGLPTILLIIASILALVGGKPASDNYTTKFDTVDVAQILRSDRLLSNYANCLLDRGNCAPDAKELRGAITDALDSSCDKCSEAQLRKGKEVVDFLINKKPALWKELEAKYDPSGSYQKKYEEKLAEVKHSEEHAE